jgi:hypothetical protein
VPAQDAVIVVLSNDARANAYDLAELLMRATRGETRTQEVSVSGSAVA